jgi:hypothetical protein
MQQLALLGAAVRLRELDAEAALIHKAFPDLRRATKNAARSQAMKRAWAKRKGRSI